MQRNGWKGYENNSTVALDSRLIGHISTGPIKHTLVAGMDFRQYQMQSEAIYDFTNFSINVWDPVYYSVHPNYSWTGADASNLVGTRIPNQRQNQNGIYFQDQMKIGKLSILLGGRQDWYGYVGRTENNYTGTWQAGSTHHVSDAKFTWRAGFTYNFDFGLTPYFSYATSFIPQVGAFQYGGKIAMKPLTGDQFEAGLKYLVPHTDVLLTAAAYHIKENHYEVTDPEHTGSLIDAGTVVSKGVEFSAHANVTRDLHLTASYSFNDARVTKSDTLVDQYTMNGNLLGQVAQQGKYLGSLPRNMVNAFADYTLPRDVFHGLGINFGARYIGFTYAGNGESYKVPGYILFDAGAHFDFGEVVPVLKGLKAQLSMSNLANTRYVTSCNPGTQGGACYYGYGRRVYGNFSYSW